MLQICRICLTQISDFITLKQNNLEALTIRDKLSTFVPELVLNRVKDPVMCTSCLTALNLAFDFKCKCLQTETNISNVLESKKLVANDVDLAEVFHLLSDKSDLLPEVCNDAVGLSSVVTLDTEVVNYVKSELANVNMSSNVSANYECPKQKCIEIEKHELQDFSIKSEHFNLEKQCEFEELYLQFPANGKPEKLEEAMDTENNNLINANIDIFDRLNCNVHTELAQVSDEESATIKLGNESALALKWANCSDNSAFKNKFNMQTIKQANDQSVKNCIEKGNIQEEKTVDMDGNELNCPVCGYKAERLGKLEIHMRIHKGEKPFCCTVCNYKCAQKQNLVRHMKIHTREKPFHCVECDYKCTWKNHLLSHMKIHTGEKPFECAECDYKCSVKINLQRHMIRHTGEKPYQCAQCSYNCAWKHDLVRHVKTHMMQKPFECVECNYKCSQKQNLQRHMEIHTKEKLYFCVKCNYKCSRKQYLEKHMKIHSGEKPFQCVQCDYKCLRKNHLKSHMKIHTGEKPYHCLECDYKCSVKINLDRHMKIHTGEKPFQCAECDYKCSWKHDLVRHVKVHVRDKLFQSMYASE